MRNAGLEEAQAGIKIAGRNINNLRYVDDTTLRAFQKLRWTKEPLDESERGEWKSGLKLNIQKNRIVESGPITSWETDGETVETASDFIFLGSKITADGDWSHEIKRRLLLGMEKAMAPHTSTLAWNIPWMEEPGRLQSIGSWRVEHDRASSLSLFTFLHWRRKWQPTPVFLPGESQGWGSSKITVDGDCSHEIKRNLLLERKAMINLDSILKSRDITLPTKVCLVKAIVFLLVM